MLFYLTPAVQLQFFFIFLGAYLLLDVVTSACFLYCVWSGGWTILILPCSQGAQCFPFFFSFFVGRLTCKYCFECYRLYSNCVEFTFMLYSTLRNVFHLLRFLRWVLCYESVADMYKNIGWYLSAQTSVLLHVQVPFVFFFFFFFWYSWTWLNQLCLRSWHWVGREKVFLFVAR